MVAAVSVARRERVVTARVLVRLVVAVVQTDQRFTVARNSVISSTTRAVS